MALTNPITGQPLTQPTFSNPFGGTVPTQKNQDILNEDYNYKRPVEQTPTPVIPVNPTQPTAEPIRPVLTPNSPYTNALNNFKTNNPDEDKIRQQEETRARLQAQTDALNVIYDKQLADQKQVYTGLQGQSRALASRGGRLESPIYQSQQIGLSDKQQQLEGVINAERTQQIANLYDRVEKRVQDKLAAERTFATSERDKYLNILKDQQTQAKGDLVTFAQGGGSLTDLTTEQYQKLLNDTGFDDFTLKATMSVNNPKSKAQFSAVGDKIVGYYVNPKTGEFETFESANIPGLSGAGGKYSVKDTANGLLLIPDTLDPNKSLDKQIKRYDAGVDYTKNAGDDKELLSPTEAAALNLPYGTTKGEARAKGVIPKSTLNGQQKIDTEIELNKQYSAASKEYKTARQQAQAIDTAYKSAADSLAKGESINAASQTIITAFGKLLDPGSVVRETEYSRSPEGQSFLNKLDGKFTQLKQGGAGLTLESLKEFTDLGKQFLNSYQAAQDDAIGVIENQANSYGLDINNIVPSSALDIYNERSQNKNIESAYNSAGFDEPYQDAVAKYGLDAVKKILTDQGISFNSDQGKSLNLAAVTKIAPQGSIGGECGIFVHKLVDIPSGMGNLWTEKQKFVDKYGVPASTLKKNPKVGDVVFSRDNETYGHAMVINEILPGGKIKVSESNYAAPKTVSHDRIVDLNSPLIYGAVRGKLKV